MKSTAMWCLIVLNVLLLGVLVGRSMKPNAAVAQNARPGDYTIIPVDFPGATVGSVFVIDNQSGEMTAIQTDEGAKRMIALQRLSAQRLFDAAGNRRSTR